MVLKAIMVMVGLMAGDDDDDDDDDDDNAICV